MDALNEEMDAIFKYLSEDEAKQLNILLDKIRTSETVRKSTRLQPHYRLDAYETNSSGLFVLYSRVFPQPKYEAGRCGLHRG